jgi:hypothetical protein
MNNVQNCNSYIVMDGFGLEPGFIRLDYNHKEQFLQQSAPTAHWQLNFSSSAANWTISSSWSSSNG